MPLDAVCLSALVREIEGEVAGARIDKIYQPARDEIILALRGAHGPVKLLLTANPQHPRLQFTTVFRDNPADAPHVLHAAAQAPVRRPGADPSPSPPWSGWWIWSWRHWTSWGCGPPAT